MLSSRCTAFRQGRRGKTADSNEANMSREKDDTVFALGLI